VIFKDDSDFARFLFLILYFQSPTKIHNVGSSINSFLKNTKFSVGPERLKEMFKKRHLELCSFAIMPNHFHLILRNIEEGSISVYMQRVLMAYGKYFNAKYQRSGHVFDGPFRAVRIENNEQLLYTHCYVHKNPKSIPDFEHNYDNYPWSSYQDYIGENRWPELLSTKMLSDQFKSKTDLRHFTESSGAKEADLSLILE
jgi:putative transposase